MPDDKGKGRATMQDYDYAGTSMKARLAVWRERSAQAGAGKNENGSSSRSVARVSEEDLLRDTVLILQGIDGRYMRFYDPNNPTDTGRRNKKGMPIHVLEQEPREDVVEGGLIVVEEGNGPIIPQATRDLIHKLSELGWLYRNIRNGINSKLKDKNAGMIELEELRQYDTLIAELETRRTTKKNNASQNTQQTDMQLNLNLNNQELGLTLYRLVVWTEEYKQRMRMMGVLVEGCTTTRGGALLTLLHGYTAHGDPFIRSFTSSLLVKVSQPFFKSLASWIYEGELVDPGEEFFVERRGSSRSAHNANDEEGANESAVAAESWSGRYRFRKEMLPSFLDEAFGKKIFSTGRSLNYIKYACGDGEWVISQHKQLQLRQSGSTALDSDPPQSSSTTSGRQKLQYGDISALEQSIDSAYSNASKRLFEIFFDKFGLLRHLRAIKDYLLLGRGDFVELLMESLGPSLSKPANTLYRHNLTATLEMAIRGSSSSMDHEDVLRRLDARMQEFSHGEIGWDVFTLEYKVDAPVDVVLDSESMRIYTRVFRHLWRVKRVEYALGEAWKRVNSEARWYRKVKDLTSDFHQARIILSEMIHFIRQLQYFSHLEVIDCSWTILEEFALQKQGDLDGLIEAHQSYVDRLASKALLRGSGSKADDNIMRNTKKAFEVMLAFKDSLDALCNLALSEAGRLDSESRGHDLTNNLRPPSRQQPQQTLRSQKSHSSISSLPPTPTTPIQLPPPLDPALLDGIRHRIAQSSQDFGDLTTTIVQALATHSDLDLRFLSVRLNFSLFYLQGKREKDK